MLRLKPSTINLTLREIRDYDHHVRFKAHLKRCQVVEVRRRPHGPDAQASPSTRTDSDDTAVWSDNADVDQSSPVVTFAINGQQGKRQSNRAHALRYRPDGGEASRTRSTPSTPTSRPMPDDSRVVSDGPSRPRRQLQGRRLTLPPPFSKTPRRMDLMNEGHEAAADVFSPDFSKGAAAKLDIDGPSTGFTIYEDDELPGPSRAS